MTITKKCLTISSWFLSSCCNKRIRIEISVYVSYNISTDVISKLSSVCSFLLKFVFIFIYWQEKFSLVTNKTLYFLTINIALINALSKTLIFSRLNLMHVLRVGSKNTLHFSCTCYLIYFVYASFQYKNKKNLRSSVFLI